MGTSHEASVARRRIRIVVSTASVCRPRLTRCFARLGQTLRVKCYRGTTALGTPGDLADALAPDPEVGLGEVDFVWRDTAAVKGSSSYYYVRGEQTDGELVWVSPMWITYR